MDMKTREQATGHAVCSPSQLYRILACPASVREGLKAPITPPSSYAKHGTLLHDITYKYLAKHPSFNVAYDELPLEDQNAIMDALDYVRDLFDDLSPEAQIGIETRITLKDWDLPEIHGTLDLAVFDQGELHVVDWKFGSGVKVAAEDNTQLMAYAAGCMAKYGMLLSANSIDGVSIHIVQPFINHYNRWDTTGGDIYLWTMQTLTPAIQDVMSGASATTFNPGEKQCRWCPASMTCRARLNHAQEAAKEIFRMHSQVSIATKEELSALLQKIKDVKKYATQIENYAMAELTASRPFPGYKLVLGRSNRSWIDEEKAEAWLSGNSSIKSDQLFKKKLVSAAQAEKLDRLLKKDSGFTALIHKPKGKPQLALEDDERPAYSPNEAAKSAFADHIKSEEDV